MPDTTTKPAGQAAADSGKLGEKDILARLADAGEEALHRIAELPGGQKALTAVNELRARVDDLAKKVRGIDALEARVAKLEKELTALKRTKTSAGRSTPSKSAPGKSTPDKTS